MNCSDSLAERSRQIFQTASRSSRFSVELLVTIGFSTPCRLVGKACRGGASRSRGLILNWNIFGDSPLHPNCSATRGAIQPESFRLAANTSARLKRCYWELSQRKVSKRYLTANGTLQSPRSVELIVAGKPLDVAWIGTSNSFPASYGEVHSNLLQTCMNPRTCLQWAYDSNEFIVQTNVPHFVHTLQATKS